MGRKMCDGREPVGEGWSTDNPPSTGRVLLPGTTAVRRERADVTANAATVRGVYDAPGVGLLGKQEPEQADCHPVQAWVWSIATVKHLSAL